MTDETKKQIERNAEIYHVKCEIQRMESCLANNGTLQDYIDIQKSLIRILKIED